MVGRKNIQEKQIRLRDKENRTVSFIKCVSSFSGILSNITGYAFSEIFQMKDPEFFTQIDGSIRIGSRSNPALAALSEPSVDIDPDGQPVLTSVSFLYLLLRVANVEDHSID